MTDFNKIVTVMCWEMFDGETAEQVFTRCSNNLNALPHHETIDIVHAGGLQKWAESLNVGSQQELYYMILRAIRRTISDPVFNDRARVNTFPPFANFFYYCQKLDRNGKTDNEATGISEVAWNGVICRRNNEENIRNMFREQPDKEKFRKICKRISSIWGFTEKQIDALRYFVCQTRHKNHNPSLNKSIYMWGKRKGTGKTTVGRAIVTILNGDVWSNFGSYESTLNKEMGYNDHELPLSALYNCVFLDETVPKDSKKSYGGVKRMLTSNSFNYNPKFKTIINIPCKRIYFFTSNDDIAEFIQDESERRFIEIEITKIPQQLTFNEIYDIWKEFAVNCEPEEDWKEWYDSFELVEGLETININEVKNEIELNATELFGMAAGTYLTVKKIADKLFKNEPTREQKKFVSEAMQAMFDDCRLESNKALYSVSECREKLFVLKSESENIESNNDKSMPF